MNGKKARKLRNMSKFLNGDKTPYQEKRLYKKLKEAKIKYKFTDL